MTIDTKDEKNINMIITSEPNDDNNVNTKDGFYESIQNTIDDANYDVMGRYGKYTVNDNGERLVNLCIANNLVIAHTKFPHKKIHLWIWV